MEKKIYFLSKKLLWTFVIVQIAMLSSATNLTTTEPPQVVVEQDMELETEGYAWSAWGSWSACSRTCGGGVSVQERQCLPRTRSIQTHSSDNSSIPPPVITVRVTRQTRETDCQGVDKRYHECNNIPCPDGAINSRAEQCAAYDRRPFRGRFYTWVPYIDGNAPCTLNCRPLGQHFFASLSLVADGTPCTRQGFRAICVQGNCKVVGREGVLSSSSAREMRCGRRLVSGLFSRPRLPLGYSYVTTVPRGACRLNVSEIMPSENYIALKISNGSYIMNGEFAVSAAGTYEAAGARFIYSRQGSLDNVIAHGPIHHPIDIMILYTQPNPSIKYEYFTELMPGELESDVVTKTEFPEVTPTSASKHSRRHHSFDVFSRPSVPRYPEINRESGSTEDDIEEVIVGNRKFAWKILSYTQCTRSCGGGIQLGKFRCVEVNAGNREVAAVHCAGSAPAPRRRRCAVNPCPPRWRAAAWSLCPACGPAIKTRIVGCVQDHPRGITKISDQKCPLPKPSTSETCEIPNCKVAEGEVRQITSKRVIRPRDHTDTFREGPVYTVTVNSTDLDVGPEYSFSATAGWLYTDWSENQQATLCAYSGAYHILCPWEKQLSLKSTPATFSFVYGHCKADFDGELHSPKFKGCVGWCVGGGVQSRGVRCADPSGCSPNKVSESSRSCAPKIDCEPMEGQWFTGDWSPCSSSCSGKQVRGVLCIGGTGRHLKDSACRAPRPAHQRDCTTDCKPRWYYGDWGQCMGSCTSGHKTGMQHRSVVCARGDNGVATDIECGPAPRGSRACDLSCASTSIAPLPQPQPPQPPPLTIESQRVSGYETTQRSTTSQRSVNKDRVTKGSCMDKLNNCMLAVQARLCHYKYYTNNCCQSCGQ